MATSFILTLTSFYLIHASSISTSTVETEGASQVASQQISSTSQRNPVVDNQSEDVKKIKVPLCIWSEEIRILNNVFGKPKGRFIEVYCDGQHYYCNGTKFIYRDPKPEAECNPQTDSEVKDEHSVKVFGTKESEQVLRRRDLLGLQIPYFAFKYDIDGNFLGIDSNSQRFEDIMRDKVTRENQVQIETLDPKNPIIYISSYKYNPTIVDDIKEGENELKCIPIPDYLAQEPSFNCTSGSSKNIGTIIQEKEKLFASRSRTCIPLLVNKKMGNNIMRFCNAYYVYLLYRNNGIASKKILYVCSEVITFELLLTRFQFRNHKKSKNPEVCLENHIIYQKLKKIYDQHQQVFWTENGFNIIIKMGFDKEYDDQELILVPYVYIEYVNPEEYELFACFFTKQLIFAGYVSLEVRLG